MYRVLDCLATQHDYRLIALAVLICAVAAVATFGIYSRAVAANGTLRYGWLLLTAICAAAGIWATHFVAMLAYETALPTAFDPVLTGASFLVAVIATTAGFVLCARKQLATVAIGGAGIGVGIGSMHYLGMQALIFPGVIEWDSSLVTASLVLGIALSSAAIAAFHWFSAPYRIWVSAFLLTSAICALHFTGMAAALFVPDPTITPHAIVVSDTMMAVGVAGLTIFVLLAALVPALMDSQSSKESSDRLKGLFDATSDGMVVATDGIIENVNRWVAERRGLSPEQLVGQPIVGGLLEGIPEGVDLAEAGTREARLKLADGTELPVEVIGQPIRSLRTRNEVYTIRDLTERRRTEARMAYLAHHDSLSGLPNRMLVKDRIKQALMDVVPGTNLAVLCLNIDGFKSINDRHGHSAGDALLQSVAQRLRNSVATPNFAARLGSDEFAVVQTQALHQQQTVALTENILEVLSKPHDIEGKTIPISVSVGISMAPDDGVHVDTLLRNAGIALCNAKASEPGTFVFFRPEHEKRLRARHQLEGDLRTALRDSQFELHYQPIVDLKTGSITCFEALMRWRHPKRGLVSPGDFIPFAEEAGLIMAMGDWALRQACRDAASWPSPVKVAVNLSAVQFDKSDLEMLTLAALSDAMLPPQRLELEVTESVLLRNETKTQQTLKSLRSLGVGVSLDDFGTAFASLDYLRSFPFDKIKIDQIFIRDMSNRSECVAIVRAVAGLARVLGLKAVAEGVETSRHYEEVLGAGCDEGQGFYFGRPVPAGDVAGILSRGKAKNSAAA